MKPFYEQKTIKLPIYLNDCLREEEKEACRVIGFLENPQTESTTYNPSNMDLFVNLNSAIASLERLNESEVDSEEIEKYTVALTLQAFTYFSQLLAYSYDFIYPPRVSNNNVKSFDDLIINLRGGYAQTTHMRTIKGNNLSQIEFETILQALHPKNPIGEMYFGKIRSALDDDEMLNTFPFLEAVLVEFLDIYKQRGADMELQIRESLKGKSKEEALENTDEYYNYVKFLTSYFELLDNMPAINPNLIISFRKADLIEKYGLEMPSAKNILNYAIPTWEQFAQVTKEQLLLISLDIFTPEGLINAFAGLDGEEGLGIASKYIELITTTFGVGEDKVKEIITRMLNGLHRNGRNKVKVNNLVHGLVTSSPTELSPTIRSEIGAKLPQLLMKELLDPSVIPDDILDDLEILLTSSLIDAGNWKKYTQRFSKILSAKPFAERFIIINAIAYLKSELKVEQKEGIDPNDLLWQELACLSPTDLLLIIKEELGKHEKKILETICNIAQNQRIYPTKTVSLNPKDEQPFEYTSDTTYKYIASLIVASVYNEKYASSNLTKIYKLIKKINSDLASTLKSVSEEKGIILKK